MELATEAVGGLCTALLEVQGKLPHLQRTKINPAFRSKYVPLEELHEEVLPILNEAGLVWITMPILGGVMYHEDRITEGQPCLHYRLIHAASGDELEGTMPLMLDKQNPQGQGSAITYARRYALMAVLGLVADDDDDGNRGSSGRKQTRAKAKPEAKPEVKATVAVVKPETLAAIKELHASSGIADEAFATILRQAGVAGQKMSEIPQDKAEWVLVALREHTQIPSS